MLDAEKLSYYFRLRLSYANSTLFPKGAKEIEISNLKKLSGGITNNVYSLSLKIKKDDCEQVHDLVLKGYTDKASLWFKAVYPNTELRRYIREYNTMHALAQAGFPVPQVYICEKDSFFLGYPFLIMQQEFHLPESNFEVESFASTLASLHKLELSTLGIRSLRIPHDDSEFAKQRLVCLKSFMKGSRHYYFLRKNFDFAIRWLESNSESVKCSKYSLIHGEYHPGHTVPTKENGLTVIDWENSEIGDPVFDVAYAYNFLRVMYNNKTFDSGLNVAESFLSHYCDILSEDFKDRIDFYKVVSLLGVAVTVSSLIADPVDVYRSFGKEAFARAIGFPFLHSGSLPYVNQWLNKDFLLSYLQYCQDFIKSTLRN